MRYISGMPLDRQETDALAAREARIRDTLTQRTLDLAPEVARAVETQVLGIMPGYIGGASTQCREAYVCGHYYCCINLAMSVVEGLSKYAAVRNELRVRKDFGDRVQRLLRAKFITEKVAEAFTLVWGGDGERNAFIHMNDDVETEHQKLKMRALGCVQALFTVESHLFAHTITGRGIRPHHPQYWDLNDDGNLVGAWLRLDLP